MSRPLAEPAITDAPGAVPVLGHLVSLIRNPLGFLRTLSHSTEEIVRIRIGPWKGYVVCDPDVTYHMLLDDSTFDKGGPIFKNMREVLGNGVAVCPHSDHRRQRRMLQPVFGKSNHARFASVIGTEIDTVISHWQNGLPVDIMSDMRDVSARSVVRLMISGLSDDAIVQAVKDVEVSMGGMFWRILLPPPFDILPIPGNIRYKNASSRLRQLFRRTVGEYRMNGGEDDLVSYLIRASDEEDGTTLSDEEISAQIFTVFAAGADTTGHTLGWAFHLLSQHPAVLKRVQAELDAVLGDRLPTVEDLQELTYTTQVVTEVMRLYPTAWFLTRTVMQDSSLGQHFFPAGTDIVFSPYLLHHRPDSHEDPETFNPDRWESDPQGQRHRISMIPFGAGPRKCLGEGLGRVQSVLSLATILSKWELKSESDDIKSGLRLPLTPLGLSMRAFKRRS
ncbi:cytochrome P450 [Amycolatopsis sp. cg5]|uniref:cytochrome P450 n=1 Tax=Amycolatopsis sp. cg5 TaxID=3238802 RepID=UPI0035233244